MLPIRKLDDYLTIKQAASVLGVSPDTLRNWDRSGKLVAHRHPLNSYRLYRPEELIAVLDRLSPPGDGTGADAAAPSALNEGPGLESLSTPVQQP